MLTDLSPENDSTFVHPARCSVSSSHSRQHVTFGKAPVLALQRTLATSRISSAWPQALRLIEGSRWRRHRPMHCWSVRPCNGENQRDLWCTAVYSLHRRHNVLHAKFHWLNNRRALRKQVCSLTHFFAWMSIGFCFVARALRPREIAAQLRPCRLMSDCKRRSSASVHLSLLMAGFTRCRHRCAHCWPVRPAICLATAAHLQQHSTFKYPQLCR
jgi:hypothetical protein